MSIRLFLSFVSVLIIGDNIFQVGAVEENVIIQTRLGGVIGLKLVSEKSVVYQFLDIPYGKAPVGHLRFSKPQAFGSWSNTLNATQLGPVCYQSDLLTGKKPDDLTEDCLKLNIYVPHNISHSNKKSVMVWIHGGGFLFGSGGTYDGSLLSVLGNVIVVTINYRLGIFGFLASNSNKAKGNAGLWDQILALDWIRYNIEDYGGNPNDVTIFGESAGGMSVSLLSLMPRNRGLFHRVIAQSGIANSFLTLSNSTHYTIDVGNRVNCTFESFRNEHNFVECLQSTDAVDLVRATDQLYLDMGFQSLIDLPFAPVVDGELIRKNPSTLLADKTSSEFNFFQSLDMMIGACDNDGSLAITVDPPFLSKLNFNFTEGVTTEEFCHQIIPVFSKALYNNSRDVSNAICEKYSERSNIEEQARMFLHMYGDAVFIAPGTLALKKHSDNLQGSATFQFVFSEELSLVTPSAPSWNKGSSHATDIYFLFFYEQLKKVSNFSSETDLFVERMRSYWTNFAKTG